VSASAVFASFALAVAPAADADEPVVTDVTILGSPIVGRTLTAEFSVTGDPAPRVELRWLRCGNGAPPCAPIEFATGDSYVVSDADLGHSLAVRVRAVNPEGEDVERSALTAPVAATPPDLTGVTILGSAVAGQTLTADVTVTGEPAPKLEYQWLRCIDDLQPCEPIELATGVSYVVSEADVTHLLAVSVRAVNLGGDDMGESPRTAPVGSRPEVATVTIAGDAVMGQTLTANITATGSPAPEVRFQWLRCDPLLPPACQPIDGGTAKSYVVADADAGRRLAVRVTAENAAGRDTEESQPTDVVPERRFDQAGTLSASPLTGAAQGSLTAALRYLRPFPVVRVKGWLADGGARISLLRVKAPRESKVVVKCERSGCPLRRRSVGVGRVRALERFLRAGTRITIRVTRPGLVGKYVRLVIRDGLAPMRRDACLLPGRTQPATCPPV
jgi:hypothetical protein